MTAACLVGVARSRCSPVGVLVWSAMALALGVSSAFSSFFPNMLELAPNHAAAIMSVGGTARAAVQVLSPLYVAYLTDGQVGLLTPTPSSQLFFVICSVASQKYVMKNFSCFSLFSESHYFCTVCRRRWNGGAWCGTRAPLCCCSPTASTS